MRSNNISHKLDRCCYKHTVANTGNINSTPASCLIMQRGVYKEILTVILTAFKGPKISVRWEGGYVGSK